jgi:AcrR family transcriptional regulator
MGVLVASKEAVRSRDPERRERILAAAAELIARRGYLGVSLGDIGASAGIVGSGIYRHFEGKGAILVELFDRVVDRLVADAEVMLREGGAPEATLASLVRGHVAFTLSERSLCEVYLQESRNLPEADMRRLKWKQRHYVDLWQDLLRAVQPGLTSGEAQVRVHGAIAVIHSCLRYHAHVDEAEQAALLEAAACRVLEITPLRGLRPVPLRDASAASPAQQRWSDTDSASTSSG